MQDTYHETMLARWPSPQPLACRSERELARHAGVRAELTTATTGLPNSLTTLARSAILALFKRIFGAGCKSRPAVMAGGRRLEAGGRRQPFRAAICNLQSAICNLHERREPQGRHWCESRA